MYTQLYAPIVIEDEVDTGSDVGGHEISKDTE